LSACDSPAISGLKQTSTAVLRTSSTVAGIARASAPRVAAMTSYTCALSMRRMVS